MLSFRNIVYGFPPEEDSVVLAEEDGVVEHRHPGLEDNEYVNDPCDDRKLGLKRIEASPESALPLMMTDDISMSPLGKNYNNTTTNNNSFGRSPTINSSQNGSIPAMPHTRPPTRVFSKKKVPKVNMNPMPAPVMKNGMVRSRGGSLPDSSGHQEGLSQNRGASFPGAAGNETGFSMDSNGYLSPAEPPNYADSDFALNNIDDPPLTTESESSAGSIQSRNKQIQRFDSGVEDCESDRGSSDVRFSTSPSFTTSSVSPRMSTHYEEHYEDIDQFGRNYYESQQQPQQQRGSTNKFAQNQNNGGLRHPNGLRPLPAVHLSGITHSDSDDHEPFVHRSIAETVSSPTSDPALSQDSRVSTLPHNYHSLEMRNNVKVTEKKSKQKPNQKCFFTLIIAMIVIFLTSIAALSLSIYLLLYKSEPQEVAPSVFSEGTQTANAFLDTDDNATQVLLQQLQDNIDSLKKENKMLKETLEIQNQTMMSAVQTMSQLQAQQDNSSLQLVEVESRLGTQLANISLQPGPQGPAGVVNFSLCVTNTTRTNNIAHPTLHTETSYLPSETHVQEYFVMFAYCSYSGATDVFLEKQSDVDNGYSRYRCNCWGQVSGEPNTHCIIHLIMCPRLQPSPH